MRDLVSCFSENAVNVSHSSCSNYSTTKACTSPIPTNYPSIQNSLTCVYKLILSKTQKQLLITVTWSKNYSSQGLTISFGEDDRSSSFKLNTSSRLFRKKKGSKLVDSDRFKIEVLWDLSNASYESTGPEPIGGFYVLVIVDSEMGLILGDMGKEAAARKFRTSTHVSKVSLISRREHCSGNTLYTTKAQFCDSGTPHEILIKCSGENEGLKHPVLEVRIDQKMMISVKKLHWNFRGHQTIFIDGLLVDLLWDVHSWFFNPSSSSSPYAVFMFRTRSGSDSGLWSAEKSAQKDRDTVEYSLLIHACKNTEN